MEYTSSNSTKKITHIYDRIFKKILTLSARAVIGLINGLFDTDYPPDSTITYNWTEHHDDDLNRTIADTIITVNGTHAYHMEAQMYEDEEIEFRVFDYGYKYALKNRREEYTLTFPEPRIIYLFDHENIPDTVSLFLDFHEQGRFEYKIPVFKLLEHEIEELNQKKMVILIPFMILKLRKNIMKKRTPENMEALRSLILDDIIGVIRKNQEYGNITAADARRLHDLIHKLYNHLYSHYTEFIEGGLNDMMEDGLILETDIIEAELTKKITKRVTDEVTKQVTDEVTKRVTDEVTKQVTDEVTKQVTDEVTKQVTDEVTKQVTDEVTKQVTDEVTKQVTDEVTKQVTKQVTEQSQTHFILKAYEKLHDIEQVASFLDLSPELVRTTVQKS